MQFDEIEQDENVNSQNITMKDPTEVSWVSPRQSFCFYNFMGKLVCFGVLVFLSLIIPYSSLAREDYPSPS